MEITLDVLSWICLLAGVFFAIVAVIHDQHLFSPVINYVLALPADIRPSMFFVANGVLSMISDNVFVATVYIGEVGQAFENGTITREQFDDYDGRIEVWDAATETAMVCEAAGIPVTVSRYDGQVHVFFQLTPILAGARRAMAESCEALRVALG